MTNIENTESGERLSFYELFHDKSYKIEIPIIQRDYAQGRSTNKDIRDTFLEALKTYLEECIPHRDLDFIYGSLLNGKKGELARFVPLDGQQRLTTLFLLHWYLATKEKKIEEFRGVFAIPNGEEKWKSKFTYKTRASAREFCDALVTANIKLETTEEDENDDVFSLSKTIKNQQWYFLSWKNDPTIQGMLVMLDAIHTLFSEDKNDYYDQLTDAEKPIITFQFLKLDEFGLTDDLYIKMNARGKPLTSFENFKAKFEKQLKSKEYDDFEYTLGENNHKRKVSIGEYFSHKIDTDWANLFWAYAKEDVEKSEKDSNVASFDDTIMNLLKTLAINYIAGKPDSEQKVRALIRTNSKNLSFNQFSNYHCFDNESVPAFITYLDLIQNGNNKAREFIPQDAYFDESIIEIFLKDKFSTAAYSERIKFHAYCQYVIKWSENNEFTDTVGLHKWMRVINNLVENTSPYNNEREFANSIRGINEIIKDSNNILDFLINGGSIDYFDKDQVKEEKLKAILIDKSEEWRDLIYKAEQHGYFNGQIGFLLRLSGIRDYFKNNKSCSWDGAENTIYMNDFESYFVKANSIFNDDGIKEEFSKKGNYLWERALLAKGDYLIKEGSNKSFLINYDRDISWRRLLKGDKDEFHPDIVEEIFNNIDASDTKNSLKAIIKGYQENDWKMPFIKTPGLFTILGAKRYVRPGSEHGFALLKKQRMSGSHAELYTYSLYLNHFKDKTFEPFGWTLYYTPSGAYYLDPPCVYLINWIFKRKNFSIEIFYTDEYEDYLLNPFKIRFYKNKGINERGEYPEDIKLLLKTLKYKWIDDEVEFKGYWMSRKTEKSTYSAVKKLCDELNQL